MPVNSPVSGSHHQPKSITGPAIIVVRFVLLEAGTTAPRRATTTHCARARPVRCSNWACRKDAPRSALVFPLHVDWGDPHNGQKALCRTAAQTEPALRRWLEVLPSLRRKEAQ